MLSNQSLKRAIPAILVTFVLLLSSLMILGQASAAKVTLYGPDGFESGISPWAESDAGRGLASSTDHAKAGTHSLKFPSSPGNTNTKRSGVSLPSGGCNFTWWEYDSSTLAGSPNMWFGVCSNSIADWTLCMYVAPYSGNDIQVLSGGTYHSTGCVLPAAQWNFIEINISSSWQKVKVRVNGGSWSSLLDTTDSSKSKTCIYRQGESCSDIYMDEFYAGYGESASHWKPTYTSMPSGSGQRYTLYSYHISLNETSTITGIQIPADFILVNNGSQSNVWLNGTPQSTGVKTVKIKALSSAGGLFEYQNFTITVREKDLGGWASYPYINAFNNSRYEYPANASGSGVTYSLVTNASWLHVGLSNGTVYGRPTATNVGHSYYCNLTANNGTASVHQNYTVKVWNVPQCADNAACEPLANIAYEAAQIGGGWMFVAYSGTGTTPGNVDIYVNRCNMTTGAWDMPYDIGSGVTDYDHNQGRLLLDDAGYVHVFYGAHSTQILHIRSLAPYSITSWTSIQSIGKSYCTYPSPILAPNGDIWVFYRSREQWSPEVESWGYMISTDNGNTWSSTAIILDWWDSYTPGHEVPYVFDWCPTYYSNWMCVGFIWDIANYSVASGVSIAVHQNVYYAYFNTSTGHLYNVSGTDLGTSITTSEKANCLVWNTKAISILTDVEDETIIRGYSQSTPHLFVNENSSQESAFHESYIRWDSTHWDAPVQVTLGHSFKENMQGYKIGGWIYAYASVDVHNDSVRTFGGDVQQWRCNLTTGTWICDGTVYGHTQTGKSAVYAGVNQWVRGSARPMVIFSETNVTNSIYSGGGPGSFTEPLRIFVYAYDTGFVSYGNPPPSGPVLPGWVPHFVSSPGTTVTIGHVYSYTPLCNTSVTFSFTTTAGWLYWSSGTTITGQPSREATDTISICATSDNGGQAWQNYTLRSRQPATPGGGGGSTTVPTQSTDWWLWAGVGLIAVLFLVLVAMLAGGNGKKRSGRGGKRSR